MPEGNRFFVYLSRFNGILIALGGLVLIAIVAYFQVLGMYYRISQPSQPADNFLAGGHMVAENVSYQLENESVAFDGTPYVMFQFNRWPGSIRGTQFGLADSTARDVSVDHFAVNLLVVDSTSAASHWLFKGLKHIISWRSSVRTTVDSSHVLGGPVTAILVNAADGSVDKKGTFAPHGPDSLYFYRLGSEEAVKFFSADSIRSVNQMDADSILVVYENSRTLGVAKFSTKDFHLIAHNTVPSAEN